MSDIVEDTRKRLKLLEGQISRPAIAEQAGVNRHWLEKFSQGVLNNPTLRNLQQLRDWLDQYVPPSGAAPASPTAHGI
jgi:hypothetical protein